MVDAFFKSDASCFGGNRLYADRRKQDKAESLPAANAGTAAAAATATAGISDAELTQRNNW